MIEKASSHENILFVNKNGKTSKCKAIHLVALNPGMMKTGERDTHLQLSPCEIGYMQKQTHTHAHTPPYIPPLDNHMTVSENVF